ncbi:MAG TPA: hypothetical protein DCF33_18495 [Saprospirales bacterium]|nr:hypothetical protein [Saprospirales bacterium]
MRSATAQVIYENDDRFEVKSAGTDRNARIVVDRELLEWADAIIVMEKYHRNKIRSKCWTHSPKHLPRAKISPYFLIVFNQHRVAIRHFFRHKHPPKRQVVLPQHVVVGIKSITGFATSAPME